MHKIVFDFHLHPQLDSVQANGKLQMTKKDCHFPFSICSPIGAASHRFRQLRVA
jgi:hypothetical protein